MIGPAGKVGVSIHGHSYFIKSVIGICYLSFFNVIFSHKLLTIMTVCRSPAISLMYASWSSGWSGVVLLADILWSDYLWPSVMSTYVSHLSLNQPSLTVIFMPYRIYIAVCLSAASVVVWGFLQVDYWYLSEAPGWFWAIPVHFMVPGISSFVIVGMLSCGGI